MTDDNHAVFGDFVQRAACCRGGVICLCQSCGKRQGQVEVRLGIAGREQQVPAEQPLRAQRVTSVELQPCQVVQRSAEIRSDRERAFVALARSVAVAAIFQRAAQQLAGRS